MPIELDPQSLKEYAQAAAKWVKKNPIPAALAGGLALLILLFSLVISSLFKDNVTPEKVSLAEDEPNLCARLHKLDALEPSLQKRGLSVEYKNATSKLGEELLGEKASPDDLAVMGEVQRTCHGMSNHDFAWAVAIEARLRRGVWPKALGLPPSASLRDRLARVLEKVPAAQIALPTDSASLDAWFKFAADDDVVLQPLVEAWLNASSVTAGPQQRWFATYQAAVRLSPKRPIVEQAFEQLGLLKKPIFVVDTNAPDAQPAASQPASAPALHPLAGPGGTLVFLGVLTGEDCALAASADPFPPLVLRSCRGLVPRRLQVGEIYLLGAEAKGVTRYTAALRRDDGSWRFGDGAQGEVGGSLLSMFVATAKPSAMVGQVGSIVAVDSQPGLFETKAVKAPLVIGFAAPVGLKPEKRCESISRDRCNALKTETTKRCDIGPTQCVSDTNGHVIRFARVAHLQAEPCLQEFGEKNQCPKTETIGLLIDERSPGATVFNEGSLNKLAE